MKFHSDHECSGMPLNVQVLAMSLCDHLEVPRWFWLSRIRNGWIRGRQRFIVICLRERLARRYHWRDHEIADLFGMHRTVVSGNLNKQSTALFRLYPDLQKAVVTMDGYMAGKFILDQFDVAVRAACGESELRAPG